MGQRLGCCGLCMVGISLASPGGEGEGFFLCTHPSHGSWFQRILELTDYPMQEWERGICPIFLLHVCLCERRHEAVCWVQGLTWSHRAACRTGCPASLCLRAVKQSPAILALSLSNKVVYYKWISQLGLEPQSSGNLSTNLV